MDPVYKQVELQHLTAGFETNDELRSAFIRQLLLLQIQRTPSLSCSEAHTSSPPRRLVQYWHDPTNLPRDVRGCLASWERLTDDGYEIRMFHDSSAAEYIADNFGLRERRAFARCNHPAMRCDYFRMCFLVAEGGLYVDADDVLVAANVGRIQDLIQGPRLKLQPLAYDIAAGAMMSSQELWRCDPETDNRVFYVNNNPLAAPAGHPLMRRALSEATAKLLDKDWFAEIQSTTGPGNLTAALAAHAHSLLVSDSAFDFELLRHWDDVAQTRWELSYRNDDRNWRNVYGC